MERPHRCHWGGIGGMGDTCCTKFEAEHPRKAELDCSLLQFIRGPQAVAGTAPTSFNTAAAAFFLGPGQRTPHKRVMRSRLGPPPVAVRMPRNALAVPVHAFLALTNGGTGSAVWNRALCRPRRSGGFHALMELRPTSAHRNGVSRHSVAPDVDFLANTHQRRPLPDFPDFPGMGSIGFHGWNSGVPRVSG